MKSKKTDISPQILEAMRQFMLKEEGESGCKN